MKFDNLTPEMKDKARGCKSTEELADLAKAEGVALSDEQLNAFAGGDDDCYMNYFVMSCSYFSCSDLTCNTYSCGVDNCSSVSCSNYAAPSECNLAVSC